jgi:hypothetical protein
MKGAWYNRGRKELLINFGAAAFKEGRQRLVNGPQLFVSSGADHRLTSCEPGLMNKSVVNSAMKGVADVAEFKRLL